MGKMCARNVMEKGAELVGAFDVNPDIIGTDVGKLIGKPTYGVAIQAAEKFEKQIKELAPDIVIVTTMAMLKDVFEPLLICAKNGVNAITTCEEAIYPWNSSPKLTEVLDETAKKNGCTITGSGAQEMQWCAMVENVASSLHKITKITGRATNNVDDFGIAFANSFGAGMDVDTFEKEIGRRENIDDETRQALIDRGEFVPAFMWNSNAWLVDKLGFTLKHTTQKMVPILSEEDIVSKTLGRAIPKGDAIGAKVLVNTTTEEGVDIESSLEAFVYKEGEIDYDDWVLHGVDEKDDLHISLPGMPSVEMTSGTIVNRLPDVINAPAGFVLTSRMPNCKYLVKSMEQYVD